MRERYCQSKMGSDPPRDGLGSVVAPGSDPAPKSEAQVNPPRSDPNAVNLSPCDTLKTVILAEARIHSAGE